MLSKYPVVKDLNSLIEHSTLNNFEKVALTYEQSTLTYKDLYNSVLRLAAGLQKLGIQKGDRVALMLPNIPLFPIAYYAILRIGAIVVPINTMFREREIRYILEDSESSAVLTWDDALEEVGRAVEDIDSCAHLIVSGRDLPEEVVNLDALLSENPPNPGGTRITSEDSAVILYTSGTTGRPKGAILTHGNLASNAYASAIIGQITSKDIFLGVLPFYHSFGQTVSMNAAFYSGARIVLLPKFDPERVLQAISRERISIFAAVPTMLKMLVDYDAPVPDLSSIRRLLSGGAKLETSLLEEFESKFGIPIHEGYGLTEASPVVTFNLEGFARKEGSVGVPLRDIYVKIVDASGNELVPGQEGEILVRGPNVMKGYLNRPEATKEILKNGWLYTGDIGYLDEEGYLYIVDRKRDMIIKGGFNVYPREIEELLLHHPAISEVAIVGVPDPVQGEEVKAYIVLKREANVSSDEIIDYCISQIARYKCPKYVSFLQSLPKNSLGRVQKHLLKRGKATRYGKGRS
ncbi:MAG: long-chain fatty acid--CoA ligase [Calditrichaeota bacterium]|nr:long-chain fatty acid--CoA ligase [Calditrichota bacterium]